MFKVQLLGGSLDGGEVPLNELPRLGEIIRLKAKHNENATESYEYRADGKLHLIGYGKPCFAFSHDPAQREAQQAEFQALIQNIAAAVLALDRFYQKHGYIGWLEFGEWELVLKDAAQRAAQQQ